MTDNTTNVLQKRISEDRINILYENMAVRGLINLLAAAALVWGFHDSELLGVKLYWFLAMALISGFQLLDVSYWRKAHHAEQFSYRKAQIRARTSNVLLAVCWSVYTVYFFSSMSMLEFTTMVVIVAALTSGASTLLASDPKLAVLYCNIMLIPLSVRGAISDEINHNVLSILGAIFALIISISAVRLGRFTTKAVHDKNHNVDLLELKDDLVAQMQAKNEEIGRINKSLEEKVERRTQEIYRISNLDPLTQLYNRSAFLKDMDLWLQEAKTKQQSISVMFIDLDGFKAINDVNGHDIGDQVLKIVARRLKKVIEYEHLICRWGGDEFIVAIKDVLREQAQAIGADIIYTLSAPIKIDLNILAIGATIGVSMYPEDAKHCNDLVHLSDTAMYQQKQTEKGKVLVFSKQMQGHLTHLALMQKNLSTAMRNKELYLVYQPVICSQSGTILAFEALLRWRCGGVELYPEQFLPVAENYGYIHTIGRWALEQACSDLKTMSLGHNAKISVNVSIVQLMQDNIVELITHVLDTTDTTPSQLTLEIPEQVIQANASRLSEVVAKLNDLGVCISIDNLGSSMNALTVLQQWPIESVKIDNTIIHAIDKTSGHAIKAIKAIQYMSQQFDYYAVAKQVETRDQYTSLQGVGVKAMQGRYLAEPMALADVVSWLKKPYSVN